MKRTHFKWIALGAALTAGVLLLSLNLTAQPRPSASPTVLALASPTPSATPAAYVSPSPVPLLPSPPATQPKITWSPTSSIEVILSPNDTTTKDFTFRSDQPLQNVVLEPVPALAPFLNVQPNSFTSVPAGQPQAVRVNFVIPAAATLGTYDGTIHLRRGSQTLLQTLKVVVNVWPSFTDNTTGLSLKYPPGWVTVPLNGNSIGFSPAGKTPDPALEYVADIIVAVLPNPSRLDLPTFYAQRADIDLFANSGSSSLGIINGMPVATFHDVFGMVPTNTMAFDSGEIIIQLSDIGQLHQADGLFDKMASSVR